MELRDFLYLLWRRKWLIVLTTVTVVVIAFIGNQVISPVYSASALIRVSAAPSSLADRADLQYVQRLMNTYTILATTRPLLTEARDRVNGKINISDLSDMVKISAIEDTELIEITVNYSDPAFTAEFANALAQTLIQETTSIADSQSSAQPIQAQIDQIQSELEDLHNEYDTLVTNSPGETARIAALNQSIDIKQQSYQTLLLQLDQAQLADTTRANSVTLIEPATQPTSPVVPRKTLNLLLGAALGVLTGVVLTLLLNNLDTQIQTVAQVKAITDLPILAEIGKVGGSQTKYSDMAGPGREAYRRLRANLFALQKDKLIKMVLITSPDRNEGKSTITYNLAMSTAQLGRSVVVVDCDMRLPTQHTLFDLQNQVGLSTVLERKASLSDAIQSTDIYGLHVLTSGPRPEDPSKLLSSQYLAELLHELCVRYDMILLDTPAIMPIVDTNVIAPLVEGIVMVASVGKSRREALSTAISQLNEVQGHVLGLVLNEAPVRVSPYHTGAA